MFDRYKRNGYGNCKLKYLAWLLFYWYVFMFEMVSSKPFWNRYFITKKTINDIGSIMCSSCGDSPGGSGCIVSYWCKDWPLSICTIEENSSSQSALIGYSVKCGVTWKGSTESKLVVGSNCPEKNIMENELKTKLALRTAVFDV